MTSFNTKNLKKVPMENYSNLAKKLVSLAKKKGAQASDVMIQIGRSADVRVRDQQIEDLTQATSKGAGIRVFAQGKLGFVWTSDFSTASLEACVEKAVALAKVSAANPHNGLPSKKDLQRIPKVGPLFDEQVAALAPDWKVKTALEMERVLRSIDSRITTIDNCGAGESVSSVFMASSDGVFAESRGTSVYLYAQPVASDGKGLQTSSWYDAKRFLGDLESAESVAREAANRTLRLIGAKKAKTQKIPVIFDPVMAAGFIASVAHGCNGDAVFKKSTFLHDKLGERVAVDGFTIFDDGLLPRGLATSPFDGEGVPTRKTALIDNGMLKSFTYDSMTARKAKTQSTGNAARGYRSLPSIGTHNLYLPAGKTKASDLISGVKQGLYVTRMLGNGANLVTGEYSRGANGIFIENGELTWPVQEVTIAGNLRSMLLGIDAIGDDFRFHGSTGAPSIRFAELTVSGE
jgi:PmbA protein